MYTVPDTRALPTCPLTLPPATALAVAAKDTCPLTFAPATAFAVVANDTAPVTLLPTIALSPLPLPVNTPVLAVNAGAVTVPLTPKLVNVPTLVMLGCAAVVTVPAVVALVALVAALISCASRSGDQKDKEEEGRWGE